jgi:predicted transposase YbfD/YdcC
MEEEIRDSFLDYFGGIEDPRSPRNQRHQFAEILFLVLSANISGAESWKDIEQFGKTHIAWLKQFFSYKNGIPSDDTLRRVFRALNPNIFQEKFRKWVADALPHFQENVFAIDGKTSRGSTDGEGDEERTIHMISAYATESNLVLAQEKVADKSNEITAIPKLLEWLDLRGATVTIDAMGCQHKIADQIVNQEGKYVLALKGNQCSLHDDVTIIFQDEEFLQHCETFEMTNKGHGRVETRKAFVLKDIAWLRERHPQWQTIQSVIRLDSKRKIKGIVSEETRYYVSSEELTASKAISIIRSHWAIENSVHWVLDMSFGEDQSRIRQQNAPQNMAIVRHIALNLIKMTKNKNERYKHHSIKCIRKMAGWNTDVLNDVLSQNFS